MSLETKSNRSSNPEILVEAFDTWNNHYQVIAKEKSLLKEDLRQEKHEKERLLRSNEKLRSETEEMHKMVNKFHHQLNRLANLEDQNRNLKSEVKIKEDDIENLQKKIQDNEIKHNKAQDDLKSHLENNYEKLNDQKKTEYEFQKHLLEKQLEDKEKYISELENKLTDVQKLKESELTKMSMDYENKLARLRQKAQTQQNPQNTANSEIFRKKLQHMKSEYEQEIHSLKQTISTLQDRLSFHSPGHSLCTGRKRKL